MSEVKKAIRKSEAACARHGWWYKLFAKLFLEEAPVVAI